MPAVQLIVGLGNPGPEHEATRHNAGFWFVDALPGVGSTSWKLEPRFQGLAARTHLYGRDCRLLKPTGYMNRSGHSIAALARYFRIPPAEILVVHDDLDLPPGTARLKQGGGDGGHNGLKSTIAQLGTRDFLRLRIGIGHPGDSSRVVSYVLKPPTREEESSIRAALEEALGALPFILDGQLGKAMQRLHTRKTKE